MGEVPASTFINFFIYLLVPFVLGFVAKKIKISPLIGYILGGIVLGNFARNLISPEIITNFATFGIILLLFTIGLDVNLEKMKLLKKYILLGGLLQVALTALAVTGLATFFGFGFLQALFIGLAFTSSSTSIVAKIIQDRGEEDSFVGEIALGILMLQDLIFIPLIIIFANFSLEQVQTGLEIVKTISISLLEALLILWAMYYLGKRLVPTLFNKIASTSRELLNLFIIIFIFMVAALSLSFNIPILVGAFVAGVLVSQTAEHYHIFSQIRPLRDLMAIIFFVYIGTHVQVFQVASVVPKIIAFSFLIMAAKATLFLLIFLFLRFSSRMAFSLGFFLFQVSENAFILSSVAFVNGVFDSEQYLFVISSVLTTLMVTPFLVNNKERVYKVLRTFFKRYVPAIELFISNRLDFDRTPLDVFDIKDHIVICGYGRIGSHVGRALNLANIPFIAIDYNFAQVEKAKKEGINIIYGDPTDIDVLDFAEVEHASVIISAVPGRPSQEAIILNSKKLNPKIFIISRVHNNVEQRRVKDLGAQSIIQPEIEASLSIIKKVFLLKHLSRDEIVERLKHLRLVHGIS